MCDEKQRFNEKIAMVGSSRRAAAKGSNEKSGCAVPLQSGCLRGLPLPTTMEDGVKMVCSNAQCPFQKELLHLECFRALEAHLVKFMSTVGSARGWTDAQRYANLWDKKGLAFVQRKCRCHCGKGLMKIDETAMFVAKREAAMSQPAVAKSKKGKTKKNLPKLNFGKKSSNFGSRNVKDSASKDKSEHQRARSISPDTPKSNSTFNFDSLREPQPHPISFSVWARKLTDFQVGNDGKVDDGWTRCQSESPVPIPFDCRPAKKCATGTSKLVDSSVTYADASSNRTPVEENPEQDFECASDGQSIHDDIEKLLSPTSLADLAITLPSLHETVNEDDGDVTDDDDCYTLFGGRSFLLGERLLANGYLPGLL